MLTANTGGSKQTLFPLTEATLVLEVLAQSLREWIPEELYFDNMELTRLYLQMSFI